MSTLSPVTLSPEEMDPEDFKNVLQFFGNEHALKAQLLVFLGKGSDPLNNDQNNVLDNPGNPEVFDIKNVLIKFLLEKQQENATQIDDLTKKCDKLTLAMEKCEIPNSNSKKLFVKTIRDIEAMLHGLNMDVLWKDEKLSKEGLMHSNFVWRMRMFKMLECRDPLYDCSFEELKVWCQHLTNELADILFKYSLKKMPTHGISINNFSFEDFNSFNLMHLKAREESIQKHFELKLKYEVLKVEFRYAIAFLIIAFLIIAFLIIYFR